MSLYLDEPRVQQWLEATKLTVSDIDPLLDESAIQLCLGKAANRYDVSGWIDVDTTPKLVLNIASMLYASWLYGRNFAEDSDAEGSWSARLERMAMDLLQGIVDGTIDLVDAIGVASDTSLGQPAFFPTDTQEFDGLGSEIKFTMGAVF